MLITTTMPDLGGGNFLTLARCSNSQPQSEPLVTCDDVIIPSKHPQSEPPVVICDDVTQQQSEEQVVVDVVVRNEGEVELEVTPAVNELEPAGPVVRNDTELEMGRFVVVENGRVRDRTLDDYAREWNGGSEWRVEEEEAAGVEEMRRVEKEALGVEETRRGEKEVFGVEETWSMENEALGLDETRRGEEEAFGVQETKLFLPFLVGAPKLAECFVCECVIYPGEEVRCAVRDCKGSYHLRCARDKLGYSPSSKAFKCPQHVCFVCNKKYYLWRCSRCHLASHEKCFAYPEYVQPSNDIPWQMVCWRHDNNWPPLKPADPTNSIEEVFCRLPLPIVADEFKFDLTLRDTVENKPEPPSYLHIRRNTYLVKKKRDDTDMTTGCNDCSSSNCSEDCLCRSQSISCSKACRCSERCTNKPFRKEKKIKIVLTELCGWGVEASESIKKGEFIIEYVGEVISDALCEERLWDMKNKGIKNFYMCEIRKDFTIDATFKGNASRFLNHSCGPNCNLEKWHVDGETRVGVFAARSIEAGEPLTYDYRFVQFGPEVKCHCGASTCQGYLGTKKKIPKFELPQLHNWGAKRRRTPTATLRIIRS